MAKKHSIIKTIAVTAGSLYTLNRILDLSAKERNMCSSDTGKFFAWKHGDIYYTKTGHGSPILLVHNLDTTSSNYEWSRIIRKLERTYTVYAIDLLGCGQSDKPSLVYSNYLYVQLIKDFVKEIIKEETQVITSADAASFVVMANHLDDSLFSKVVMINPPDLKDMKMDTTNVLKMIKAILFTPLIGTSLYNYYMREENIKRMFRHKFFSNRTTDITRYLDIYYQSAHANKSNGRFLYASKKCAYTNIDMTIGLKDKDNIYIIESTERNQAVSIADAYVKVNNQIEVTYLSNTKLLPALEKPEQTMKVLKTYLEEIKE